MDNFTIDFSTVPNIGEKLSSKEIQFLNDIFQKPEVVEKLKEIEVYRKKRQKAYGYVTLFMIIVTLLVAYFIGKLAAAATAGLFALIIAGLFFRLHSGDDSFGTIEGISFLGAFLYGRVYIKYRSKIEIPLKRDIMSRICSIFHKNFIYSYDAKYSFNDLGLLLKKKFLKAYNVLELVEDSVNLKIVENGKGFVLNGFELKTRHISGSGKRRKNVVTNHDYLMKVVFPYARIPIKNDLLVIPDKNESKSFFGKLFSFFGNKHRIILEDVEFEKMFDVHCDDEVTSRMILTPAFMNKLTTFVKKTGNTYSFLFTDNTVYIKRKIYKKYMEVGTKKNMFQNISGFLDFYIDMREILFLSRDIHFMYLSNTVDTDIQVFETEDNPIPFDNNPKGVLTMFSLFKKGKQNQKNFNPQDVKLTG